MATNALTTGALSLPRAPPRGIVSATFLGLSSTLEANEANTLPPPGTVRMQADAAIGLQLIAPQTGGASNLGCAKQVIFPQTGRAY